MMAAVTSVARYWIFRKLKRQMTNAILAATAVTFLET
jgi:hypothetical protein